MIIICAADTNNTEYKINNETGVLNSSFPFRIKYICIKKAKSPLKPISRDTINPVNKFSKTKTIPYSTIKRIGK